MRFQSILFFRTRKTGMTRKTKGIFEEFTFVIFVFKFLRSFNL